LECSEYWRRLWATIQGNVEHKINSIMEGVYEGLHKKLCKLKQEKGYNRGPQKPQQKQHFHPRVLNLTNTKFSEEEN
jgi:hypothetical protein